MALVSCVIPTRDRPELLAGAVDSALAQSHGEVEVLVVHEPGDEAAASVAADAGDRVTGLAADAGSPTAARNAALAAASGDYVAFLDDDDRWHPEKLERQLPHADDHAVVSCVPRIRRPEGESVVQPHEFSGVAEMDLRDVFEAMRYFPGSGTVGVRFLYPSGTLARASVVRSLGGFDEALHEWDFYLRAVRDHGPAAVLDRPLVEFNREDIDRYCERTDSYRRLSDTLEAHRDLVPPAVRRERLAQLAYGRYARRDGVAAVASLARALRYDPRMAALALREA